jgi:hypothetical protein
MATATRESFIKAIKEAVSSILADFGLPTTGIGASTCPHKIEQFDSDIGIFGTVMVSTATGIEIPLEENIFLSKSGKELRTIEQTADRLLELQAEQSRKRKPNGEVGVAS